MGAHPRPAWRWWRACVEIALALGLLFGWVATCATPSSDDVMDHNRATNKIACGEGDGGKMSLGPFLTAHMTSGCELAPVATRDVYHLGLESFDSTTVFVLVSVSAIVLLPLLLALGFGLIGLRGDLTVPGLRLLTLIMFVLVGSVLLWARAESRRAAERENALDGKLVETCSKAKKEWDLYAATRKAICDRDVEALKRVAEQSCETRPAQDRAACVDKTVADGKKYLDEAAAAGTSCDGAQTFDRTIKLLQSSIISKVERDVTIDCPAAPGGPLAAAQQAISTPRNIFETLGGSRGPGAPVGTGGSDDVTGTPDGGSATEPSSGGGGVGTGTGSGSGSGSGSDDKKDDKKPIEGGNNENPPAPNVKNDTTALKILLAILGGIPAALAIVIADSLAGQGDPQLAQEIATRIAHHLQSTGRLTEEDARDLARLAKLKKGNLDKLIAQPTFAETEVGKKEVLIQGCVGAMPLTLCQFTNEKLHEEVPKYCNQVHGNLTVDSAVRFAKCRCGDNANEIVKKIGLNYGDNCP